MRHGKAARGVSLIRCPGRHGILLIAALEKGSGFFHHGHTGNRGDHVLVAPPFVSTPEEIDEIVRRLGAAADAALATLPAAERAIA